MNARPASRPPRMPGGGAGVHRATRLPASPDAERHDGSRPPWEESFGQCMVGVALVTGVGQPLDRLVGVQEGGDRLGVLDVTGHPDGKGLEALAVPV